MIEMLTPEMEEFNILCKDFNIEINRATMLLSYYVFSEKGISEADKLYPLYKMTMREMFIHLNKFIATVSKREFRNLDAIIFDEDEKITNIETLNLTLKHVFKTTNKQHRLISDQAKNLTLLMCLKNDTTDYCLYYPDCYAAIYELIRIHVTPSYMMNIST